MTGAVTTRLPTTRHRRGRVTARQAAALASGTYLVPPSAAADLADLFGPGTPVVLDIGFGSGGPVADTAQDDPATGILAVDMHTPGIGDLLARLVEGGLSNVRVIDGDARDVLDAVTPGSLTGVRTFFPDPWPKSRHHRRRLIQAETVDLVASRVRIGGFWHLATDWPGYAAHIEDLLTASAEWSGGVIPRPASRPVTRFERTGLTAGRPPLDLWFERVDP